MNLVLMDTKEKQSQVISYIGDNYKFTPYLYVNVIKYGLGTDNCKCFIDIENGKLRGVYLKYFDCLHFYTNSALEYPVFDFLLALDKFPTRVIMTTAEYGSRLEGVLSLNYTLEKNNIIDMDLIKPVDNNFLSCLANKEDIEKIVDLMLTDKEYTNVYSKDILFSQMLERFNDGFSRYFVVKDGERVVASCSTYGEVKGFALIGSVIVHKDYRRKGLGSDVESFACAILEKEHINRVGFVNYKNNASLSLHQRLGAKNISTLYKFILKDK